MGAEAMSERRRLALFTNSVQIGGMEEHVCLLAAGLDRARFHVTAIVPDWQETHSFSTRVAGAADAMISLTPDRRHGALKGVAETIRLFLFARRQAFDIVHMHSTSYKGQWLALLAFKAAGVPRVVLTEHLAPETRPPLVTRVKRYLVSLGVTSLVCVSERNRQARATFLHTPPESTYVVANGIDLSRFDADPDPQRVEAVRSRYGIPAGAHVVGTAIRLEPGKGVGDLVDSFAIVRDAHGSAFLLLVGDGSMRSELEAQVRRLGLESSTVFVGFVDDPRELIQAMDVFVLPVPFGSASIGLLEAMAMSRPSIITFGGEGEAIEPGVSGFWAEPSNPSSIAEFVCRLLDDAGERVALGRQARERVERAFSSTRVAEELSAIYLEES